jgi:hypothetical protein
MDKRPSLLCHDIRKEEKKGIETWFSEKRESALGFTWTLMTCFLAADSDGDVKLQPVQLKVDASSLLMMRV